MPKRYEKLEKLIDIKFRDEKLVETAFTHRSYINEHKDWQFEHNERLEFLGDAVLELVVTEFLFKNFPDKGEGVLTTFRAALVKGNHLADIANRLKLGAYLYLSHGEEKSGGRKKDYILANALEALIVAIYLDNDYDAVHSFIDNHIIKKLESIVSMGLHIDAKSRFQEIAQDKLGETPEYRLIQETGPDHDKTFIMGLYASGKLVAKGKGTSKQKAELAAAASGLKKMKWSAA